MFNFDWLSGIDLSVAKTFILCAFLAPLIFSLFLKKEYIYQGAVDVKPWRNLKIWIMILTIFMIGIYSYF
ncbi:MAG: hypothetical protein KKF62_06115 [Bacteroidetes bacterium]|nr:hypothetical protein [Bacteroidota bacterium]MBU1113593.1 hypothetical protein [Bacteroidota bacterium]MBU1796969.1 hypothetical protein [Bacteroidota bacterium]